MEEGNLPPKNMQKSYYFGESFMTINKAFQKGLTTTMWENRPVLFLQCAICIYRYISIGKSWDCWRSHTMMRTGKPSWRFISKIHLVQDEEILYYGWGVLGQYHTSLISNCSACSNQPWNGPQKEQVQNKWIIFAKTQRNFFLDVSGKEGGRAKEGACKGGEHSSTLPPKIFLERFHDKYHSYNYEKHSREIC